MNKLKRYWGLSCLTAHQEKKNLHPEHPDVPDGRDILDATSQTQTQLTTAWGIQIQLPQWCAFRHSLPGHRVSGRSTPGYHVSEYSG